MALIDTYLLSIDPVFRQRVQAAFVHAAVAVSTEVTNEVQTLSITGGPTGGTFTLTFAGQTTATIAFNATAATVQAALATLSSTASGTIVCTGGPLPGTAVVVTFSGGLGNQALNLITIGTNSLTGGSSPTPSVARTTAGVSFVNHSQRQSFASDVLRSNNITISQLSIATADNSTVQADFPASRNYQPMGGNITGATNVNPIVITSNNHGLANNQSVTITGVGGNTAANGTFLVTVVNGNTFSIPVAGNGTYTSGGTWVLSETQLTNDIQFTVNSIYNAFLGP